jgi:hypothetical protein
VLLLTGAGIEAGIGASTALAQQPADDIDDKVAAALYDRGMELFERGDVANAKKMFIESLERSPKGSRAEDALRMLRASNEKLGIGDPDHGRPAVPAADDAPLDPYGQPAKEAGDEPLDPYASGNGELAAPMDPYGPPEGPVVEQPPTDKVGTSARLSKTGLVVWSGLYGFELGLALGGPMNDAGEVRGGAVLAGVLGAGAGVGLSYWLSKKYDLTGGQSVAIASAGTWGAYNIGLLGDVFSGDNSETNTIHNYIALGGLLGTGAGVWYAAKGDPTEGQISFVNSMSMIGTSAGLLLGVAIDPPRSEAYSLNAVFGSALGIGAGMYFKDKVSTSRRRMFKVDIGAAAGAASTWVLLYPLMSDENSGTDEQVAGFVSTLTMLGGAGLAWYLTRNDVPDEPLPDDSDTEVDVEAPAAPAFARRDSKGQWTVGAPLLRPMELPALAPRNGGLTLGLDILSGRF